MSDFLKQGKVKFFNEKKGYGFIIDDETKKEYFFHFTNVIDQKTLVENDEVYFEIKENKRGLYASGVKLI